MVPTILRNDEVALLKKMKEKGIQEIIIKKTNEKAALHIKTTKELKLSKEKENELKRILGIGNYQSVTLKTNNGEGMYITSSRNHKNK